MNRKQYLNRIGIKETDVAARLESLNFLQRQHLLTVPFENLDIHWERPINLDNDAFFNKVVIEKRGGFCYELNGLFYKLLNEIGFQNKIISARVADGNGGFSREYDHLAILTQIGKDEYLVDVGFGSFTAAPLKFTTDVEQQNENGVFLIRKFDGDYFEVVKKVGELWQSEYIFSKRERGLAEFAEMCRYHQTSPESHFTRGKVCSLMTLGGGRKTLTDEKFIETENGQKAEITVNSVEQFNEILAREFGIKPDFR